MPYDSNLTEARPSFLTHLECSATRERYEADQVHGLSRAGKPLLVRYDLDGVRGALTKAALAERPRDLWRWRELLPVREAANIVSLGECETPLIPLPRLGSRHGATAPIVKDEGRLPTGSFKARGLVMAVSMAKALGITRIAMPTNGNAGAAAGRIEDRVRDVPIQLFEEFEAHRFLALDAIRLLKRRQVEPAHRILPRADDRTAITD